MTKTTSTTFRICAMIGALMLAPGALAQESSDALTIEGRYVVDAVATVSGGDDRGVRVLHEADIALTADLEALAGWSGVEAGVQLLAADGKRPNDLAGTLQGIDNIEVEEAELRIYQFWIGKSWSDRFAVRAGLLDLNADFYANDPAGLLIAPAFGIGSELAATGPNGPSIFPQTAWTLFASAGLGENGYVQGAVVNAHSGILGRDSDFGLSTREGALLIAEAGVRTAGKIAIGYWRYTNRQPDIRETVDREHIAQGVYLLLDRTVSGAPDGDGNGIDLFARAGLSEGDTTPFRGGFQFGMLARGVFAGRPDSQFSVGFNTGLLSNGYRAALATSGIASADREDGIEITYADRILPFLIVQPDMQYVRRAFAEDGDRDVWVMGLRLIAELP